MNDHESAGLLRKEAGEVFRRLTGDTAAAAPWEALDETAPALADTVVFGLAAVVGRPGLDLRTRQLVTVAVLAALGGCDGQLAFHVGGALRNGARAEEVVETLSQVALYAGVPRAINAVAIAHDAIAKFQNR
ncbi:carboxymuconolactone decarboxylase family protein [Kitasatospora sp. NPDC056138]|uniref:carboxymuconolactone decarboxylase family protein n=1 Tax=Kitasatospora sp. NPDC056138 TaxID=3345724 RepID=UPI0035D65D40